MRSLASQGQVASFKVYSNATDCWTSTANPQHTSKSPRYSIPINFLGQARQLKKSQHTTPWRRLVHVNTSKRFFGTIRSSPSFVWASLLARLEQLSPHLWSTPIGPIILKPFCLWILWLACLSWLSCSFWIRLRPTHSLKNLVRMFKMLDLSSCISFRTSVYF